MSSVPDNSHDPQADAAETADVPSSELAEVVDSSVEGVEADTIGVESNDPPSSESPEDDAQLGAGVDPAYEDDRDDVEPLELEIEEEEAPTEELDHRWYILKVQVNRETSICDALRRRVKINGLDAYFKEVLVPTEDVAEFNKSGKRRVVKKKLYPGYIMVNMVINDDTWFLVRETGGIGDFTGSAGKPTPMDPADVERILRTADPDEDEEQTIKTTIPFSPGDRVRIKEGGFENFEGDVETIHEANGQVTVIINIFGRPNPVDLAHWQIEKI